MRGEGILEDGDVERGEIRVGDENIGRGGQVGEKIRDDEVSPNIEVDDNILLAQDRNAGWRSRLC